MPKEEAQTLRSLFNDVNVGLYMNTPDEEGSWIEANKCMCEIFGYGKEEFLRTHVVDLYQNKTDRRKFIEIIFKNKQVKNYEIALKKRDGTQIICAISATAKFGEDGKISHINGMVQDITQTKQKERACLASEQKYKLLFDNTIDYITIVDLEGNYLEANPETLRKSGFTREEFLQHNAYDLNRDELKTAAPGLINELKTKGRAIFESEFIGKAGDRVPVEVNASLIVYNGEPAILTIGRDITERKKWKSQIDKYTEELKQKISELERFKALTVGRELKMVELKDEIRHLKETKSE